LVSQRIGAAKNPVKARGGDFTSNHRVAHPELAQLVSREDAMLARSQGSQGCA
jgi:hypothetical protein